MLADLNVGRVVAHLELDAHRFAAGLTSATSKLQATAKRMRDVGRRMTTSVTLPLVAMGAAQAKVFTGFESSLSKIVGLVGVAGDSVDKMGQQVLQLAPRVAKGPGELADALFFVTSAGLRGGAAMETLQVSARGAAAGLGETKVVADAITSAINAYGAANVSAAYAGDVLVATVREGKAEADELAQVFGRLLPMASNLGVRFDELGAALAAMTRIGLNANEASTALRGALNLIAKQGKQAKDALESVGLSSEGLRRQVREEGLLATLTTLSEKLGDAGDAFYQVFPNVRALTGVLSLTGANSEKVKEIFAALAKATGALDYAFAEAAGTAKFQFQQVLASLQVSAVKFGQGVVSVMLPAMRALVRGFGAVSEAFFGLSRTTQQVLIGFAVAAAAIGPLLVVLGLIATALSSLVPILTAATAAVFRFAASLGGPVLLIGALGAAMWIFRDDVKEALEYVARVWQRFFQWLEQRIDVDWTAILNKALTKVGEWGRALASRLEMYGLPPKFADELYAFFENFPKDVGELTIAFGDAFDAMTPFVDRLRAKLEAIRETIVAWGMPLDVSKMMFAGMEEEVARLQKLIDDMNNKVSKTNETVESVKNTTASAFSDLALALKQGTADFATFVNAIVEGTIRIIAEKTALLAIEIALAAISGSLGGVSGAKALAARIFKGGPELQEGGVAIRPVRALVGEAGREAIIPLDRLDEFAGAGDVYLNIQNNAPVQVEANERRGPGPDRMFDVVINEVSRDIARGGKIPQSFEMRYPALRRRMRAR